MRDFINSTSAKTKQWAKHTHEEVNVSSSRPPAELITDSTVERNGKNIFSKNEINSRENTVTALPILWILFT